MSPTQTRGVPSDPPQTSPLRGSAASPLSASCLTPFFFFFLFLWGFAFYQVDLRSLGLQIKTKH